MDDRSEALKRLTSDTMATSPHHTQEEVDVSRSRRSDPEARRARSPVSPTSEPPAKVMTPSPRRLGQHMRSPGSLLPTKLALESFAPLSLDGPLSEEPMSVADAAPGGTEKPRDDGDDESNHSEVMSDAASCNNEKSGMALDLQPEVKRTAPKQNVNIQRAAQDGNLEAMRSILDFRPADINLKNSATWHSPLHTAAAAGHTPAVEFLLSWKGQTELDIEARNMYAETPLHVAAKYGHQAIVRLLLAANASVHAQAMNGMTPLHLAVWTCGRSEDANFLAVVDLLLEHHSDLYIKDRSDRSPLDLLASGNRALSILLQKYVRAQQVAEAEIKLAGSKAVLAGLEDELACIVGVPGLKEQLRRWAKGMLLDQRRRALGLDVQPQRAPHMAFLGSPGTGKTTVARALARMLHKVGVLAENKVVEVQRTDLVGEFVGHSGPKTRKMIALASGGILFVDEAYRLIPPYKSEEKDYGLEALEEIMAAMDSGKLVVIFAGYAGPMQRVFQANEGFRRRVTKYFVFEDLAPADIAQVMLIKMEQCSGTMRGSGGSSLLHGFRLHEECSKGALAELVETHTSVEQRSQHNGALALTSLLSARDYLDSRLDLDCYDPEELTTIRLRDIAAALTALNQL